MPASPRGSARPLAVLLGEERDGGAHFVSVHLWNENGFNADLRK